MPVQNLKSQNPDLLSQGLRRAPAKTISWKWNAPSERESTKAFVFFGGYPVGELYWDPDYKVWNARVSFTIDGGPVISLELHEGYRDMKSVGDNLFFHLQRLVRAEGFAWPI